MTFDQIADELVAAHEACKSGAAQHQVFDRAIGVIRERGKVRQPDYARLGFAGQDDAEGRN